MITCTWTGTYGLMTSLLFSSGISHICSMQTRFKLEMEKEDKTFYYLPASCTKVFLTLLEVEQVSERFYEGRLG